MFTVMRNPDASTYELIAASRDRGYARSAKVARRFCRRAQRRGLNITVPPFFNGDFVVIHHAGRAIRFDADGAIIPSGADSDPGWRSNAIRLHCLDLKMAARFRRRGQYQAARDTLTLCALDRAECPKLPG